MLLVLFFNPRAPFSLPLCTYTGSSSAPLRQPNIGQHGRPAMECTVVYWSRDKFPIPVTESILSMLWSHVDTDNAFNVHSIPHMEAKRNRISILHKLSVDGLTTGQDSQLTFWPLVLLIMKSNRATIVTINLLFERAKPKRMLILVLLFSAHICGHSGHWMCH